MAHTSDVFEIPGNLEDVNAVLLYHGVPLPDIQVNESAKGFSLNGIPFSTTSLPEILPELITLSAATYLMKANLPEEMHHLFYDKMMNPRILQRVLQDLLKEGVSVKNMRHILESCLDFVNGPANYELLYEYTRKSMKEQIAGMYTEEDRIHAVYFSKETTDEWQQKKAPGPEYFDKLMDAFVPYKLTPVAVVEDGKVRHSLAEMYPGLHWLSIEEVPMTTKVFVMEDFKFPELDGGA